MKDERRDAETQRRENLNPVSVPLRLCVHFFCDRTRTESEISQRFPSRQSRAKKNPRPRECSRERRSQEFRQGRGLKASTFAKTVVVNFRPHDRRDPRMRACSRPSLKSRGRVRMAQDAHRIPAPCPQAGLLALDCCESWPSHRVPAGHATVASIETHSQQQMSITAARPRRILTDFPFAGIIFIFRRALNSRL
jgi:hypothetical protein